MIVNSSTINNPQLIFDTHINELNKKNLRSSIFLFNIVDDVAINKEQILLIWRKIPVCYTYTCDYKSCV